MNRGYQNRLKLVTILKHLGLSLSLLFTTLSVNLETFAQAPLKAQLIAENFARAKNTGFKSTPIIEFDHITQYKDIWIFESSDPKAFVLVKKEDAYSIAGYSFENTFSKNGEIPAPARLCLEAVQNISLSESSRDKPLKSYPQSIEPLLQTKWNQDCFFNHACPTDYNGYCDHVAVGCVPVAIGQILKYYERFNKFVLEEKFESSEYPDETVIMGNYDWDKMADEPICIDLEASRFLHHMGVISRVLYNPENTSTSTYNAWVAFGKMTYLESVRMIRSLTIQETWVDGFYNNISQFMPIYVAGSGHAFVCDGYDSEGFFHFNLGWGGSADGYYPLIGTGSPFISEALVKLRPHSLVLPPINLQYKKGEVKDSLIWAPHQYAETLPFKYRIYQDGVQFAETENTSFPVDDFVHGRHMIKVSAWYVNGESRWIGPIEIYNQGREVSVPDNNLRIAMNKSIGFDENESELHNPTADELIAIKQISVDQPVYDLQGIEYCRGLLELNLRDNKGEEFDLKKLADVKKLKVLNVNNALVSNLDELNKLNQLVYLDLNNVPIPNTNFLSLTSNLLDLSITNTDVPEIDSIIKLFQLEYLDLTNTGLQNAWFVNKLSTLKGLNLSDNNLEEFELVSRLSKLRFMDLNNNMIDEMKFIENTPNIVSLNMDDNRVSNFELFKSYVQLVRLSFANNEIIPVKVNQMQPKLVYIDLSGNHITNIDRLVEHAPNTKVLNLRDNGLSSLWNRSFQHLTYLDLAENFVTTIDDILLNPSLLHLDLSHNAIGDFYPLTKVGFYENLEFLRLAGNTSSRESFIEWFPLFRESIDTIQLDELYTPFSPSYPLPLRNKNLSGNTIMLSWETKSLNQGEWYELFFGEPGEMELISSQLTENQYQVDILPDRRYQWQVVAHSVDTSFTGGIYNFRTFPPIELPFFDGFEDYQVNDYVSLESPYWITKNKEYHETDDGRIVSFRRFTGNNSLSLQGNSHLIIPIDNFSGQVLYIECALLVHSGDIACIRLTEISGIKLEIYFKVNKSADVLVNDKVISSFGYTAGVWNPVRISLSGNRGHIYVQVVGLTSFSLAWKFPKGRVNIENIEFSGERSPNFPSHGYPLFYIDDLRIRELNSVSAEPVVLQTVDINIFPNPADQTFWIQGDTDNPIEKLFLINLHGQIIKNIPIHSSLEPFCISTEDLPTGIYWLRFQASQGSGYKKVIISH